MGVPSIDAQQCRIIDGLDAVFDDKEGAAIDFLKIIQKHIGHAVGTSAYHKPYHIGNGEGFFVSGFEVLEGVVGVGVCLKISKILHFWIFRRKEVFAFFQLLRDGLGGGTIVGIEGLVVAIGAASLAHSSIAVGTSEARIEGYLLRLRAQLCCKPRAVVVIHHGISNLVERVFPSTRQLMI